MDWQFLVINLEENGQKKEREDYVYLKKMSWYRSFLEEKFGDVKEIIIMVIIE